MPIRVTLLFIFFTITKVIAQENLKKEIIDVVQDFEPKVMLKTKLNTQPLFVDTSKVSEYLNYSIRFEDYKVYLPIDSLPAVSSKRTILNRLFQNKLHSFIGSSLNPRLMYSHSSGRNTKYLYDSYVNYDASKHNSSNHRDFSRISLGGFYKSEFKGIQFLSDLNFTRINRFNINNTKRSQSYFNGFGGFKFTDSTSVYMPSYLALNTSLNKLYSDQNELTTNITSVHKGIDSLLLDWTLKNQIIFKSFEGQFYKKWNTELMSKRTYDLLQTEFILDIDIVQGSFSILPSFYVQYPLISNTLYTYCDIGVENEFISWSDIYKNNPFLKRETLNYSNAEVFALTNKVSRARIGLVGNLYKGVNYQISTTFKTQDHMMHYVHMENNVEGINWIAPVFTSLNSIELSANIEAEINEKNDLILSSNYSSFNKYLSYIPRLEVKLFNIYDFNEQWSFSSLISYIGSRESIFYVSDLSCYTEERKSISPSVDIDLRANYDFDKQLNFFVELVNVLNQDYEVWNELPVNRRQLNVGVNYLF